MAENGLYQQPSEKWNLKKGAPGNVLLFLAMACSWTGPPKTIQIESINSPSLNMAVKKKPVVIVQQMLSRLRNTGEFITERQINLRGSYLGYRLIKGCFIAHGCWLPWKHISMVLRYSINFEKFFEGTLFKVEFATTFPQYVL